MQPTKQPFKIKPEILAAIIVAAATILAAIISGIFLLRSTSPTSLTPFLTATQIPTSTLAASANQTPTMANPTASPQDLYTQITNSNPTFTVSLQSQDNNNWSVDTECFFSHGAYHVSVPSTYFAWCIEQSIHFSNFIYQAQINIVKGDYGGIVFREDFTNIIFYYVYFGEDGSYNLFLYKGIKGQQGELLRTGHTSAINIGLNQQNLVAVLANGSSLYLYINKQFVTSAIASTSRSGQIGIIALPNTKPTEVVASNIQVWQI